MLLSALRTRRVTRSVPGGLVDFYHEAESSKPWAMEQAWPSVVNPTNFIRSSYWSRYPAIPPAFQTAPSRMTAKANSFPP
jgi:hypothetical protein